MNPSRGIIRIAEPVNIADELAKSTPFEVGVTDYEGEDWQLVVALTGESTPTVVENDMLQIHWTGKAIGKEKWLFLHVESVGNKSSEWSFAFDCNEPQVLVFLQHLLHDNRLMIAFPERRAVPVDGAADKLKNTFGRGLETFLQFRRNSQ